MKIELKHDLDFLEIDATKQAYSFETYDKELFTNLTASDYEETYFESSPELKSYVGWGNYADHGDEFVNALFLNLGLWFTQYPESIDQFIKQVNQHI
ncbi:MAG TPA: hypothetical protein V6C58_21465 [Allocoleopsis sp.]